MKKGISVILMVLLIAMVLYGEGVSAAIFGKDNADQKEPVLSGEMKKTDFCIECHSNLSGNLKAAADKWKTSIHSKNGIKCSTCHGGDPSADNMKTAKAKQNKFIGKPANKKIPNYCGRKECHKNALNQFKKSPHLESVLQMGSPTCVSCHGSHNVQRSSINIISDKTCNGCHPAEYSREIISTIFSIEKDLDSLENDIEFLKRKKAAINENIEQLKKTKSLFHQMVHVFSREDIKITKKMIDLEIESLKGSVGLRVSAAKRMDIIYLITIIICIAITIGFAVYIIRNLAKHRH